MTMNTTNVIYKLISVSSVISILLYMSCSGNDEPAPPQFDCNTSDLSIQVMPTGVTNPSGCNNTGSITATAAGGGTPYTYALNGSSTFQSSATFSNIGAGSYSITVKDSKNCTKTVTNVVLIAPGGPEPGVPTVQSDTECSSDNGSITVNASGGSGTLTYSKDGTNFQGSNLFSSLRAGNYTITVKDAANCTVTVNATVPNGTGVAYDNTILPIFQIKCQFEGCHPTNGNWFDYNTAKNNAQIIKTFTGNGTMPKGGSSAPGGALSADQIAAIACWVDHGTPK